MKCQEHRSHSAVAGFRSSWIGSSLMSIAISEVEQPLVGRRAPSALRLPRFSEKDKKLLEKSQALIARVNDVLALHGVTDVLAPTLKVLPMSPDSSVTHVRERSE